MPSALTQVHPRFRTPYISIILFCLVAVLMLSLGFFTSSFFADLGALYVFGSLLCFAFAHASIIALRLRKPELPRAFKLGLNIHIKGREIPTTAVLGLLTTAGVWMVILWTQPYSRFVGFGWMLIGFLAYYLYRRWKHLSLTKTAPKSE